MCVRTIGKLPEEAVKTAFDKEKKVGKQMPLMCAGPALAAQRR